MKKDPGNFPIFQMIFPEKKIIKYKYFSKFGSEKYSDISCDLPLKVERKKKKDCFKKITDL